MSECVVRMEMPQNCINCDLRYECNAFYATGKHKPFMKGCRIVCQLPEEHGRLVDAYTVVFATPNDPMGEVPPMPVTVDDLIESYDIPTIVPAERSET